MDVFLYNCNVVITINNFNNIEEILGFRFEGDEVFFFTS